jgi:pimeloyl-ACP methyl ester carboxylesterase
MFYSHYKRDLAAAMSRVRASGSHVAETERGPIEYVDCGHGLPVLWIHGVVGGSDQGPGMSRMYIGEGFRVIAVSRFGYVRSPLPQDSSPAAQADAYAALLDTLGIQKVALVGTSAGAASSLHFALRHPDRCSALVLWSMAVPPYQIPSQPMRSALQAFFGSDFVFWAMITHTPSIMLRIMGVPGAVQNRLTEQEQEWLLAVMCSLLPISLRVKGIMNDICVSNPGMNEIDAFEGVSVPVLIIHAVDDPMPPFAGAKQIAGRLSNSRFIDVNFGGHLLVGNIERVRPEIMAFIKDNAGDNGRCAR